MKFARWTFAVAGIYGLLALIPHYFQEASIAANDPPAITHPEYFYGFIGVALAFQFVFLLIARDPLRFRPIMPVAVLEKLAFAVPVALLYANGRISQRMLLPAAIDLILGILFAIAFLRTRRAAAA